VTGSIPEAFADVVARIDSECEEALFAQGSQLVVRQGGEVLLDWAGGVDGLGRPVTPDNLFAIYCAGKPVLALGIATQIEADEVSLNDRLRHLLPGDVPEPIADLTVAHLLTHTAGLHHLSAFEYLLQSRPRREAAALAAKPPMGWVPGRQAGYAEAAAWHLLAMVLEELVEEPAPAYLEREVLGALGVEDVFVVMSDERFRAEVPRIGVNSSMREMDPVPMLYERTREMATTWVPGFGSYASARGLSTFYQGLLDNLAGKGELAVSPELLEQFVTRQRPALYDEVLVRECCFGFGFMVELADHLFGPRCSPEAFGHSGNVGMTAAMADPAHDLVVSFHSNGLLDGDTSVSFRRPQLFAKIYDAVLGRAT
jgi:CubicO group peptidase (beta-lactamase class C family)